MNSSGFDQTACAYGMFQVAFAEMADRLAWALCRFRSRKEPDLSVKVRVLPFGKRLERFKEELEALNKQLEELNKQSSQSDDIYWLSEACNEMHDLAGWRNVRIHARVERLDPGLALYDWRTNKPLALTLTDCENNIQRAIKVTVSLMTHVPLLVDGLEMRELMQKMLADDSIPGEP